MKRNPLSIAFGNTLRELRNDHSIPVTEISEAIGINDSYYRVLESGATSIHTSKAIEIYNGLRALYINVDYEGIRDVLLGISYVNNFYIKTKEGYLIDDAYKNTLFGQLDVYEHKLSILLKLLNDTKVFENLDKSNKEIIEIFKNTQFTYVIENFITNYKNIGESVEVVESNFIKNFFDNIPTYYFEYLNVMKNQLLDMPIAINLSEMHKWEIRSGEKFKSISVIIKDHNYISSYKNLKKYKYTYLWNKNFERANFIYLNDEESEKKPNEIFEENLLKSCGLKKGDLEFSKTMKKVNFIKPSDEFRKHGLEILSQNERDYNTFWFFTLHNEIKVGFMAIIDDAGNELEYTEGFSMKYGKNMINILKYIKKLIE